MKAIMKIVFFYKTRRQQMLYLPLRSDPEQYKSTNLQDTKLTESQSSKSLEHVKDYVRSNQEGFH